MGRVRGLEARTRKQVTHERTTSLMRGPTTNLPPRARTPRRSTSMGYDLRITRSTDWTENHGLEIASTEWLSLVQADPELTPDPANGPFAAAWSSAWFDWFEGNVFTTDPDHATVAKMLRIATSLEAVVQGDSGEFYENARQWSDRLRAEASRSTRDDA